jgi:HTH-type transcriptional regulator, competence development regulator
VRHETGLIRVRDWFGPPKLLIPTLAEHEQENSPRDDLVERVAAILEVKLEDLFCEAGRLPPDLRGDIKAVVTPYRRSRNARNSTSK